jgi:hypothetical protein
LTQSIGQRNLKVSKLLKASVKYSALLLLCLPKPPPPPRFPGFEVL